jgi:hypothetical protein
MIEARLIELRRLVRARELPTDLVEELRGVVRVLVRRRLLPPSFAPYGQWDEEAVDELFQSWFTERLLGQGHLQLLLDRARTPAGLKALAERSLRQHLISSRDRSQAHNLYRRLIALLEQDPSFRQVSDAQRPQDRWYALSDSPSERARWSGDDRLLIAHGWALGDFIVIRYKATARKLSPVLDLGELQRFAAGLLARVQAALTPAMIMRALAARFALGEPEFVPHEEQEPSSAAVTPAPQEDVALQEVAQAIIGQLSWRQLELLRRTESETVAEMAAALECSVGTVINEQRRIGELVARLTESDEERDRVLNMAVDLAYEHDDE